MDNRSYYHGKSIALENALLILGCETITREQAIEMLTTQHESAELHYNEEVLNDHA